MHVQVFAFSWRSNVILRYICQIQCNVLADTWSSMYEVGWGGLMWARVGWVGWVGLGYMLRKVNQGRTRARKTERLIRSQPSPLVTRMWLSSSGVYHGSPRRGTKCPTWYFLRKEPGHEKPCKQRIDWFALNPNPFASSLWLCGRRHVFITVPLEGEHSDTFKQPIISLYK